MNWCYAIRPIRIHKSRQAIIKPLSCCPLQLSLHLRINKAHNDLHSIKKFMRNGILISVWKIWAIYYFKGQQVVKTMSSCHCSKSEESSRCSWCKEKKSRDSSWKDTSRSVHISMLILTNVLYLDDVTEKTNIWVAPEINGQITLTHDMAQNHREKTKLMTQNQSIK